MEAISGRWQISSTFMATMQPSSAPPMVDMWPKPSVLSQPARSLSTTQQAIGYMPPEMPLPVTRMSGTTP